jgi:predicted nucleic acid-binding protein
MPRNRPSLLVDAGPFIAWFDEDDHHAADMATWVHAQERQPAFGHLYVLDHVIDEAYIFLRRGIGLDAADAFLERVSKPGLTVVQVAPREVMRRMRALPAHRRTSDVTYTDVAIAEFAQAHGLRHVLTFDRALAGLGVEVVVPGG